MSSKQPKVWQVQRWTSERGIRVWNWVWSKFFQPFYEIPRWPRCTVRCMFCQVTCLNAYDACKEWLSIWVDRGVSWVLDDCILRPQEAARLRMCWQGRRGSPRYGGKQRWYITVPRGRCLWFTPVSSICRRQRVDLRCMHQVTGGQIPLVHKRTLLNLGVLILETVAIILSKKRYLYWVVGIKGKKRWLNFNESLNHGTCMSFALSAVCLYYLWFLSNSANQLLNLSTAQAYSIPTLMVNIGYPTKTTSISILVTTTAERRKEKKLKLAKFTLRLVHNFPLESC